MTDRIDLHTHSTASDGTLSPKLLARNAKDCGLDAIALTDHDTIDGLHEFHKECTRLGIESISGVEISAEYEKEMHILGLYVDEENLEFAKKLNVLKNAREIRNKAVLEKAKENGMNITQEDIFQQKEGATLKNTGRAHIARSMVEKGYAKSVDEAFAKYLKRGKSCYVKRLTYSPKESIELVKNSGGCAVLAHPVYITEDYEELYSLLERLRSYGLDGVECYYNSYTKEFSEMCGQICDRLGLVKSGGSDFHGANKPDIKLGRVSTGYVPYRVLLNIKQQRGL